MKTLPMVLFALSLLVTPVRSEEQDAVAVDGPTSAPSSASEVPVVQAEDTAALEGLVGGEVVVEGVVRGVGSGPDNSITFLNFGERRTGFVAVIFRAAYDKFPDGFDRYSGQKVRVRGQLEKYRDRQLQIKISAPDQLEVVAPAGS